MKVNQIVHDDCREGMDQMPPRSVDLVFADPPYNIGLEYDEHRDRMDKAEYMDFTWDWLNACWRVLKKTGSIWVAINDENAAEMRLTMDRLFHRRSWVIWEYGFGVNCKGKFSRCHTHLLYYTKSPTEWTFNAKAILIPSKRQTEYNDKRAVSGGKIPPDVWKFSRVCGTFKERCPWHPTQMPLAMMDRIIRTSSNKGDVVLDPFSGTATTCIAATKLGRKYIGIEMSENYVEKSRERIAQAMRLG